MFQKVFKYIEPAWTGNDGKFSLRSALAIFFSINLMVNVNHAVWKWDSGRSLEGLALILGIEASLIAGLLVLKTFHNPIIKSPDIPIESIEEVIEEVKAEEIK